jgi:hypothetical protein
VYPYVSVQSSDGCAKLGEVCFKFFSTMTAGDFFKGLEFTKANPEAPVAGKFRKDGQVVSLFPENLDVLVGIHTWPCNGAIKPQLSLAEVEDQARSRQLKVEWKRGSELRPTELIAAPENTKKPTFFENSIIWNYTFHIRARNVPLTDHLVVSLFGPKKGFLGRVAFNLTSDLVPPPGPTR